MAVYNPMDDMILQDPAYAQDAVDPNQSVTPQAVQPVQQVNPAPVRAGQTYQEIINQPSVQDEILQGSQTMANIAKGPINLFGDVMAQTLGRIAENMVNPEAAERGRMKSAIRDEAHKMFGVVPAQMTPDMIRFYEQRTGNKYEQLTFEEGINSGLNFILEDAIKGSQAIQQGARFTDLPGAQQLGVGLLPLEFWFGGGGARKVGQEIGSEVIEKFKNKPLAEIVSDPQAQQEIPEVVEAIKQDYPILVTTGNTRPVVQPDSVVFAPEKGEGLASSTPKLNPETKAKRDKIFEEKRKIREAEIIENAKKYDTKKEAIAASGLSDSRFNTILRKNNLTPADLGLKVGKRGTPDTSAAKKKILDDFLANNPDKTFTRQELAEATGMPKSYVRDTRIYQSDAPNLVTHASRKAEEFDKRIKGMNELLEDLKRGIAKDGSPLDKNMGPEFYKSLGYTVDVSSKNYIEFPKVGQYEKLIVDPADLSGIIGTKTSKANEKINNLANYLNINGYKSAATEYGAKRILLRDYYRGLSPEGRKEFDRLIMDPEAFGFLPRKIMKDGLPVRNPKRYSDEGKEYQKQAMNNLLGAVTAISGGKDNLRAIQKMQADKKILNDYADKQFYDLLQRDERLQKRFISEANRVAKTGLKEGEKPIVYKNWEDAFENFKDMFHGQLSHVVSSGHLGTTKDPFKKAPKLEGKKQFAGLMRINFGNHNISLQPRLENVVERNVKRLTKNSMNEKALKDIATADVMLKERGMLTYMRFTNDEMSEEVFRKLQGFFGPRQVFKEGGRKTIMLGQPEDPTVDQLKRYLDNRLTDYENNPNTFILSAATPDGTRNKFEDEMMETGDNAYIAKGFLTPKSFQQGGPVKMAMGGDPLTNLNQQQFAPDPAFEGQDYFSEAVESGNLYAFNPTKLFKLFGKVDGVQTPKKITEPEVVDAPAGTTLPATQVVQPQDFPFRSYTLEAIMDPNAPKAATPQAWADFLVKGKQSPLSELKDSGLEQYLRDFEAYFPNQKITQTQLIDYYETSPIGNLSFKVKEDAPVRLNQDPAYSQYSGKQRHKEMGNQPLDEIGSEYREIVVEAGPLPGETKPYVQSGHYEEPNVIGFTRVANYTGKDGRPIAVIQELQTDMLTTVRKEQERLNAMLRRIENFRAKAQQKLQSTSEYDIMEGQRMMENLNQQYPPNVIKALEENSNLIKPFPNEAAKELIPGFAQDIQDLQKQIDAAVKADIAQTNPETGPLLTQINQQQMEVLTKLQDLNRSGELDAILSGVKVPGTRETDELRNIAESQTFTYLDDGFGYGKKDLTLFPPIPFNKQPDYVDLLLKATIKDAQSKGINKVAIFPADLVNRRWGKTPGSDAAKKFEDLYGKVAIQQMKNIAKKYGGTAQFEAIIDPTKATKGLRYYNKNIDGKKFDVLKEEVPRASLSDEEVQPFFDEQIRRIISGDPYQGYPEGDALASSLKVALTREVAPGQTMDYYVLPSDTEKGYILQPFKEGDSLEDAQIVIEEFNPQEVKMFTITLDSPQAEQPMYLFKKKSGGSIDKDSLVSITDIYGEYGR